MVRELQNNAQQKDYLPVRGLPALREAVASYYRRTQNLPVAMDNVLIGPGSKELMFILQLVYYGDLVIPTPSWVSYAPQAHIIGRHVYWLETDVITSYSIHYTKLYEPILSDAMSTGWKRTSTTTGC